MVRKIRSLFKEKDLLWQNNRKTRGDERKRVEDRKRAHKKNKHNHQMMLDEETTTKSRKEPIQGTLR